MFKQEEILERLYPLLKIRSVKGEPQENAPFGEGAKKALDYVLSLAESMGFETVNYDNYIGEVIFGEGKPFGVLCHLDVVPEGELSAWITPPYEPTIRDGKLFCRGAVDDKSPAISVLSAMYEMKKQGLKPHRQIRLILGCDEESGWGCIDHYNECAVMPEEGISPDADFPVIYAEKGIIHLTYKFKKLKHFRAYGGVKANVVCDKATAEGDFSNVIFNGDPADLTSFIAVFHGKTAHGSTPDKGDNAIKYMTAFLEENDFLEKGITDRLFGACEGAKELCDETGHLTFSPNIVNTDKDYIYYTVDCRYPSTLDKEFVESYLKKIGEYEVEHYQPPLFVDKNSKLVTSLINIYNEVMGTNAEPIAIGGGTYARALKSAVAFGPCIGEEGDTVHMPNEFITLDTLMKMTEIYYRALVKLCVE